MEIGENFPKKCYCSTVKKITQPNPWKLTFLAMNIDQLKIRKFAYLTGKGI